MKILKYLTALTVFTYTVQANPDYVVKDYSGSEILDPRGLFSVKWKINWPQKRILLNATVKTKGWVGLGFSKDGEMKNADIMIAWVSPEGKGYISDYYADCDRNLKLDERQDWNLLGSSETGGKTHLQLTRLIDTCDPHDYPITDDLVHLLWAYGETDTPKYHYENRGSFKVFLLDPVVHASPIAKTSSRWKLHIQMALPLRDSSYICSFMKMPTSISRPQHIIEARAFFDNEVSLHHTHHMLVYRCIAPNGSDAFTTFEPFVGLHDECYFPDHPSQFPKHLCTTIVYFWTLGGNPFILPYEVGILLGKNAPHEYYMMESHVKNPEKLVDLQGSFGVEFTYMDRLRPNDGGAFLVAYDLTGFFLIPPAAYEFEVLGHCGTNCTNAMFPNTGIDIYAVHLHSHSSAAKMKLHHFRDTKEKPWIMKDDNYDFRFQQIRPLHYFRKLLPGDQLTVRCTYDFSNNTEVAGFSFHHKMNVAMIYHLTPIPYFMCVSQFPQEKVLSLIGIKNATWDKQGQERFVREPAKFRGQTVQAYSNRFDWGRRLRYRVQGVTVATPQSYVCPRTSPAEDGTKDVSDKSFVIYPFLKNPYGRVRYCPGGGGHSGY